MTRDASAQSSNPTKHPLNAEQPAPSLDESYTHWRSSSLGQITDALEQRLLADLLGPIAGKMLLDVGCGDGAWDVQLARDGAAVSRCTASGIASASR
jgi:2-polyprenyl-3-methyl-5-hydroxy-6-metoxy-1,4-benzoquinol methylase